MSQLRSILHRSVAGSLVAGVLLLAACGEDTATTSSSTTPAGAATAGTSPAGTTSGAQSPAAPDASPSASASGSGGAASGGVTTGTGSGSAGGGGSSRSGGASGSEGSGGTSRPASTKGPSADVAQNAVLQTLTALEACHTGGANYRKCATTRSLKAFGAPKGLVESHDPQTGQVAVTSARTSSFKIVGTDRDGTRWVFAKSEGAGESRTCRLASGKACTPKTW